MNDNTDKLAAEMQNLRPSKASRESGLSAAMAAFNKEFAAETTDAKAASSEKIDKNSTSPQGLADDPRPTGQTTTSVRVKTRRVETMSKLKTAFNFKPQTMMMAGTCSAALIAAMIVIPNMDELTQDIPPVAVSPVEVAQEVQNPVEPKEVKLVDVKPSGDVKRAEIKPDVVKPLEVEPVETTVAPQIQAGPQTIVKTRRVLKTPARTTERTIPSATKTETRRVIKTPASTVERSIPAVTKQVSRRVPNGDGTFETVSETVVVQPATVEYVTVPPVYETVQETIVVQEASTELVTIPATFDTIRETIEIQADGTEKVISSELVADTNAQANQAVKEFRAVLKQTDNIALFETQQGVISQTPPPAPQAVSRQTPPPAPQVASLAAPATRARNNQKFVPSRPNRTGASPSGSAPTSSALPDKIDGFTLEVVPSAPVAAGRVNANTRGQFTVFNGVVNQVVQSTETIVNETGEILCRVIIPAKYKTVTKQVIVSPARAEEVTIPAVTKDYVVKLANGDGTFREEIKKVVIEEERVDYVITPAKYETRSERILIEPAREEWKPGSQAINANTVFTKPAPPKYVLRDDNGHIVREFKSRDALEIFSAKLPVKVAGLSVEKSAPKFETKTETIVIQPASVEDATPPPSVETVLETIVVQDAATELVTTPAEYEWVDGDVEGSSTEIEIIPAEFETVTETVVVQPASVEYIQPSPIYETVKETILVQPQYTDVDGNVVPAIREEFSRKVVKTPASTQERTIPAVTKAVKRRVLKTPARVVEKVVSFEKKDGKTRVVVKAASVQERVVPAVTKQMERRVFKQPAVAVQRTIPAVTKEVQIKVLAPQTILLRDEDGNVVWEFKSHDAFEKYKANLPTSVAEKPVSTFSVDVDTASYSFLRASINRGQLPPPSAIRLEEMINYFPYDYDAPKSADEPFKANVTVTPNPWNADTKLMHIGIKGYVPKQTEKPRSNLVFLIDTSGSMNRANKLPLLINSFKLLLNTLDEDDTVSIVAYASASGTVLEPTRVRNKSEILSALNNLRAGGSTAGAAGLELAYQKAQESFYDEGVNRVILATDGDFNVGFSSPDDMKTFIQKKRKTGIFLSVLGFGMGNYNDHLMQSLAQNGNGVAAYIDSLAEANKVLANEAGSALFTIAKDVKIQVEFNPSEVAEYRLIGYETRALKRQDFNNDKVDAGEIGAGHSVTAIYEMTPVGSPAVTVDKLRYVSETPKTETGSDEYAFVKIRHKLPDADKSTLQTFPIGKSQERSLKRAGDDTRFAAAVAIVGQKLRGDTAVEDYSYEDAIKLANSGKGDDDEGYRAEFIQMVKLIETMEK